MGSGPFLEVAVTILLGPGALVDNGIDEKTDFLLLFSDIGGRQSKGTFHITHQDPVRISDANFKHQSDPNDIDFKTSQEMVNKYTQILTQMNAVDTNGFTYTSVFPNTTTLGNPTDLTSWLKAYQIHGAHYYGTCRMGKNDNNDVKQGGVVNSETLEVHNVKNLSVADVSIMPVNIRGGPQGAAYAMAEHTADLLSARFS